MVVRNHEGGAIEDTRVHVDLRWKAPKRVTGALELISGEFPIQHRDINADLAAETYLVEELRLRQLMGVFTSQLSVECAPDISVSHGARVPPICNGPARVHPPGRVPPVSLVARRGVLRKAVPTTHSDRPDSADLVCTSC